MARRNDRDDRIRALLACVLIVLFAVVVMVILAAVVFQRPLGLTDAQTTQVVGVAGAVGGLLIVVIRYYFRRGR